MVTDTPLELLLENVRSHNVINTPHLLNGKNIARYLFNLGPRCSVRNFATKLCHLDDIQYIMKLPLRIIHETGYGHESMS